MSNEIILLISLFVIYIGVFIWFCLFGKEGLYCFTVIATITANIEVLILVRAYGMEQTLGNVLFGATFLITDILSEISGKKAAQKAVNIGVATSLSFIIISQSWFLYIPSENDWVMPSIEAVFTNTPRLMIVSLLVYAIVQSLDVFIYHKWWQFTEKKFGDKRRFLWLRNNGSTLISQLLNTVLFTLGAFWGMYNFSTLLSIILSTYVIYIVTSLFDTPIIYMSRLVHEKFFEKSVDNS